MVVGYELEQSLKLKVGDTVKFFGREFVIVKCHAERGTRDDITIWTNLRDAQAVLDKPGLINAILAVECRCAWADLAKVREEITRILPETQVIEQASTALARAEARQKVEEEAIASLQREEEHRRLLRRTREQFAAVFVPLIMLSCALWIGYLAFGNVRERRAEIGILRALGLRSWQVHLLFLSKAGMEGLAGGVLGCIAGFLGGRYADRLLAQQSADLIDLATLLDLRLVLLVALMAPVLAIVAAWIPSEIAAQQNPAEILRAE